VKDESPVVERPSEAIPPNKKPNTIIIRAPRAPASDAGIAMHKKATEIPERNFGQEVGCGPPGRNPTRPASESKTPELSGLSRRTWPPWQMFDCRMIFFRIRQWSFKRRVEFTWRL
jgi:hypothetical protein